MNSKVTESQVKTDLSKFASQIAAGLNHGKKMILEPHENGIKILTMDLKRIK